MRGMMRVAAAVALSLGGLAAGSASAQAFNGAGAIERGDYASAERDLVAQRALYPDNVDLMINLASVYLKTGRLADARRMYAAVEAQPDQEMVLSGGSSVWSQALAARALRELPVQVRVQVASR